jgi:hypothetical protein
LPFQRFQIYAWDRDTRQAGLQAYMVYPKTLNPKP